MSTYAHEKNPPVVRMNAVFHYIKTLAIVHKSRCYNHLANMKPKSEHHDTMAMMTKSKSDRERKREKRTQNNKTKPEKLKQWPTVRCDSTSHHLLLTCFCSAFHCHRKTLANTLLNGCLAAVVITICSDDGSMELVAMPCCPISSSLSFSRSADVFKHADDYLWCRTVRAWWNSKVHPSLSFKFENRKTSITNKPRISPRAKTHIHKKTHNQFERTMSSTKAMENLRPWPVAVAKCQAKLCRKSNGMKAEVRDA